jgi:hypothetical protein
MSRSSTPGARARHPAKDLTPAFDGYPYLVSRIGHSALRHIAILPAMWSPERLLALTRRQALANRLDTCLVLGPGNAVYVTAGGAEGQRLTFRQASRLWSSCAGPSACRGHRRSPPGRARLGAYAAAIDSPRYIVGDGLEAGRVAILDDIFRLGNLDGEDAHRGLARCPTCGEFAGDYLATKGEGNGDLTRRVIGVYCRCENHNRCARCGEPLADRRLSAYHFVEETGSVCYVAADCAFSHRCLRRSHRGGPPPLPSR